MVRVAARRESPAPPPPRVETAITRSRSANELKLEALQKEHERLLRDIAKRKAACTLAEQAAREAATAFALRVEPLRAAFYETLKELRTIFTKLLADGRLNKRDRTRVRRLYQELMPDLDVDGDEAFAPGERARSDFDEPPFSEPRGSRSSDDERARDPEFSAPRPAEKGAAVLRAVFRRLAIALHPDKVQDAAQKEQRTAVMKDITRAYEAGDVARLLEIERSWLAAAPLADDPGGLLRRIAGLLGANTELRKQLRTLTAQLKSLKQDVPRPARKARGRAAPGELSETELFVRELERELGKVRSLRDFAHSFAEGRIGIDEFVRGPRPAGTSSEDELLELLSQVLDDVEEPEPYERPARRAKRGSGRR
jgi:hypothetical protein